MVHEISAVDGFFKDAVIKILMPQRHRRWRKHFVEWVSANK